MASADRKGRTGRSIERVRVQARAGRFVVLIASAVTAIGVGGTFVELTRTLIGDWPTRDLSRDALRAKLFGEYGRSLTEIEVRVPSDGEYLLIDKLGDGMVVLVQGDLSPRRAWLVSRRRVRRMLASGQDVPPLTVLYEGTDRPLRVVETASFAPP